MARDVEIISGESAEYILPEAEHHCPACAAHHPGPQPTGNLQVDPEIRLPSPGMDVVVSYFYNSFGLQTGPFGHGRTITPHQLLIASADSNSVRLIRGDGSSLKYNVLEDGGLRAESMVDGIQPNLVRDDRTGHWIETDGSGVKHAYPIVPDGHMSKIAYREDSVGNRHTYAYDKAGLLTALTDAVSRKVVFRYNGMNLLSEIEDWAGRKNVFEYDTATNPSRPVMTKVTGPTGCQTSYACDKDGRLTGITDPNGHETTYGYDDKGRVTARTIAGVGTTKYEYDYSQFDTKGEFTRITTDALGNKSSRTFDRNNRLILETSAMGRVTTTSRVANSRSYSTHLNGRRTGASEYDHAGRLAADIDAAGLRTEYTYDEHHNLTSTRKPTGVTTKQLYGFPGSPFDETGAKRRVQVEIDMLGNKTVHTYNKYGQRSSTTDIYGGVTKYEYDDFGNLASKTIPTGAVWKMEHDAAGNVVKTTDPYEAVTMVEYDARNRPTKLTDALGYVTRIAYDGNGNKTVVIDALGNRWEWKYNVWDKVEAAITPMGRVTSTEFDKLGRVVANVDPAGNRSRTEYDADGKVVASYDAPGNKTSYEYDAERRRVAVVDPLGNKTQTVYDDLGRPVSTADAAGNKTGVEYDEFGRRFVTIDALGNRSATSYDEYGRVVAYIDPLGNKVRTVYDENGRIAASIDPLGNRTEFLYDASGQQVRVIDALGRATATAFDSAGRRLSVTNSYGAVTKFEYDLVGRQVVVIDPLGSRTQTGYDALGRVTSAVDPLGNKTTYAYDSDGRRTGEANALGHVTRFEHDLRGNRAVVIDANGNATRHEYDAADNVVAVTDAKGIVTKYQFDSARHQTLVSNPDGESVRSVYDALGRETERHLSTGERYIMAYDASGQRVSESNSQGEERREYDPAGRLSRVLLASGGSLGYKYDAVGRRTEMLDMSGGKTTYVYDAIGRTSSLTNPYNETTRFEYNDAARTKITRHPNGVVSTISLDPAGQEVLREEVGPDGGVLASYRSEYDACGNRTSVVEHDGSTTRYDYDETGQLLSEIRSGGAGSWNIGYRYDVAGNRIAKVEDGAVTRYEIGPANELLATTPPSGDPVRRSYDACGRLVTAEVGSRVTRRNWDASGRLATITDPDGSAETNDYNLAGIRISRAKGPEGSRLVVDGQNVIAQIGRDGTTLAAWTHANDRWGGLLAEHRASETRIFGCDPSSNTRILTDAAGRLVSRFRYEAYGVERPSAADETTPFRFGGQYGYWSDSRERLYVRARWLDAATGKWDSLDDLRFDSGDWNLYRYAANCPVTSNDPTGNAGMSCSDIYKCYTTKPGSCTCASRHKSSPYLELMLCLFWQETSWGQTGPWETEGIGSILADAFDYMMGLNGNPPSNTCSYLSKYGSYADFKTKANQCEKIWAAMDYVSCRGLNPHGYGPWYTPSNVTRLRNCAQCIETTLVPTMRGDVAGRYPCECATSWCLQQLHSGNPDTD